MRWLTCCGLGWLAGFALGGGSVGAAPLPVAVSVVPQQYFVQRVGGEQVAVSVLVGPGQNPHSYEPGSRQTQQLAAAQVYFGVGISVEQAWLPRLQAINPAMRVVATVPMPEPRPADPAEHEHAHENAHEHDPHAWTDPRQVMAMLEPIQAALSQLDPAHAETYRRNAADFRAELEQLDGELRGLLQPLSKRRFLVFHPAWDHFAEAYGLEQVAIEVDGKEPGGRSLATLLERASGEGFRVLLVQPQFSRRSAQQIADAIGAQVVVADPLEFDYPANLRRVARLLADALQ